MYFDTRVENLLKGPAFCMNLCTQIVYVVLMMLTFLDLPWCTQNICKMYPTFWQTFIYILYKRLSCHSPLNFVYKTCTKVCLNLRYILYTSNSVVYVLHNFCRKNVSMISVWVYKSPKSISLFFSHIQIKNQEDQVSIVQIWVKNRSSPRTYPCRAP